jgi:trk system potassium uptake protein TrkA
MLHVTPHEGWIGHPVSEFQTATRGRVGLITRFGVGEVPTRESVIQDGDSLHVLTTETGAREVRDRVASPPEEMTE